MSMPGGSADGRLLRSITDLLPAMVAYWDADRRLRFANAGYRDWFSPQRDPLGRSRAELHGTDIDATDERCFADALAGQARQFERRLVDAQGQARRVKADYRPDRREGGVAGVVVMLTELDPPRADAGPPVPVAVAAAAPAPPSAFAGIPGLTMARALMFLPGRDQVYARVLKQFASHYGSGVPGLDDALQGGRADEARRLLHSLRGACGAVGATALAAQAHEFEQSLATAHATGVGDNGTWWTGAASALAQQLAAQTQAIERRLQALSDPAASGAETGAPVAAEARRQLLSGLESLAGLLRVADFRAGEALRALAPALRSALGEPALRSLERPLRAYEHEAALQALAELQGRLQDDSPPGIGSAPGGPGPP